MTQKPEIVVERFGKDGWFFVTSQQLPSLCIFGPTLQEVKRRVRGAIALALKIEAERIEASLTKAPAKSDWHEVDAEELLVA